jgi:hypothetical protein
MHSTLTRIQVWLALTFLLGPSGCSRRPLEPVKRGIDGVAPVPEGNEDAVFFFYDSECPDCKLVRDDLLQPLVSRLGLTLGDVAWRDVSESGVTKELLGFEERLGFSSDVMAPVIVWRTKAYCGIEEIRRAIYTE